MNDPMDEDDPLGGRGVSKKRPLEEEDDKEGPPLKQTKACQDFLDALPNTAKRYYYWHPPPPVDWKEDALEKLSDTERYFMDQYELWRPSLSRWLKESHDRLAQRATSAQRQAIAHYSGEYYQLYRRAYYSKSHGSEFADFDSLFTARDPVALVLPENTVLFEGHDNYREQKEGDTQERYRPTSASWALHIGIQFTSSYQATRPRTLYIHRFPDETVIAVNAQLDSTMWHEAEVLVQPRIRVRIDRVLLDQPIPYPLPHEFEPVHLVFTTVTAL